MRQSKWLPRLAWLLIIGGFIYAGIIAFSSPVNTWAVEKCKSFPERMMREQASDAMKALSQQYDDHLRSTIIPAAIMLAGGLMALAARPEDSSNQNH